MIRIAEVQFEFTASSWYNMFNMGRKDEMKRIRFLVSNWLTRIDIDNNVDYFDINREAEETVRKILNKLMDIELENLNLTKKRNFPGIDLAMESGFAVQVTSQRSSEKILDSLGKFEKNELYKIYPKGIRFFILNVTAPNFRKKTKAEFCYCYKEFNPDQHIWNKSWLLKRITSICYSDSKIDRIHFKEIGAILEEEFRDERRANVLSKVSSLGIMKKYPTIKYVISIILFGLFIVFLLKFFFGGVIKDVDKSDVNRDLIDVTIKGFVKSEAKKPIKDAKITIDACNFSARSNENGCFLGILRGVDVKNNKIVRTIRVWHPKYNSVEFSELIDEPEENFKFFLKER